MADGKWTIQKGKAGDVDVSAILRGQWQTVEIEAKWTDLGAERHLVGPSNDLQYLVGQTKAITSVGASVVNRNTTLHVFRVLGFDFSWTGIRLAAESQLDGGLDPQLVDAEVSLSIRAPAEEEAPEHEAGDVVLEDVHRWEPIEVAAENAVVFVSSREISIESPNSRNRWSIDPSRVERWSGDGSRMDRIDVSAEELGLIRHSLDTATLPTASIESSSNDGAMAKVTLENLRLHRVVRVRIKCDPELYGRPTRVWPVEFIRVS